MSQATEDNTEKPTKLECIDAINEHLRKALGIIGLTHGAMAGHGALGDGDVKDAMWAAYDELEAVKDAFDDLKEHLLKAVS